MKALLYPTFNWSTFALTVLSVLGSMKSLLLRSVRFVQYLGPEKDDWRWLTFVMTDFVRKLTTGWILIVYGLTHMHTFATGWCRYLPRVVVCTRHDVVYKLGHYLPCYKHRGMIIVLSHSYSDHFCVRDYNGRIVHHLVEKNHQYPWQWQVYGLHLRQLKYNNFIKWDFFCLLYYNFKLQILSYLVPELFWKCSIQTNSDISRNWYAKT